MNNERERDDAALIAEMAEALSAWKDAIPKYTLEPATLAKFDALLAKLQPPAAPEPDRAEVLWDDLFQHTMLGARSKEKVIPILNRHFAELRAEIEAERPVIDVPADVLAAMQRVEGDNARIYDAPALARFVKQLTTSAGVRAPIKES